MFADGSLQNYIEQNLEDPWRSTPFEGYVYMSPKQKGEFGERFTTKYLEHLGHKVKRAKTSTAGHDRVVDDFLTEIKFSLPSTEKVHLVVYDLLGNVVREMVNEDLSPGKYTYKWKGENQNGSRVSAGMYFYQIQAGSYIHTKKMILLK